jgi:hypothetical protein
MHAGTGADRFNGQRCKAAKARRGLAVTRQSTPSRCPTPSGKLTPGSMNSDAFTSVLPSSEVEEAAFQQALSLSRGLFAHQVEGVAFLLARRRAILADDMGLGKTRQSILALRHAEPPRTIPEDVVFGRRPRIRPTHAQRFQTPPPSRRASASIMHPDGVFADGQVCGQRRAR